MGLRHLIRDGGRHQLIDLGSVFRHGKDKEGLVVWKESRSRLATCVQRETSREAALTCGHGAHQYGVELDDGAEGVFGVCGACQVFAVTFKDEALILFL